MSRQVVGEAVYNTDLDTSGIAGGVRRAEGQIRGAGKSVEDGFAKPATSSLGKVASGFDNLRKKGGAFGVVMQGLGVGAGFGAFELGSRVLAGTISYMGDAVTAASDLGETVSKASVIFGEESMPALERWAETASDAFGQSKQQALDGAATFAIFGKSAGLAGTDLTGFSTDLVMLASDLASFHNASPEEVIEALGAALRGEAEPIRKYGVLLDDASLRAKALEMGLISTTKNALEPQQRVLAAQALIMEQTSDAQGDFERTSGGLANQQRKLSAKMQEVSVAIGELLLPVMTQIVSFMNDAVIPAFGAFGEAAEGMARFSDAVSLRSGDVERVMEALGLSYMEARDRIKIANRDMGLTAAEYADQLEATNARAAVSMVRASDVAEAEYMRAAQAAGSGVAAQAQAITLGGPVIAKEAGKVAGMFPSEIRKRVGEIRAAGRDNVVQFAAGLIDAQNDPKTAIDAMVEAQKTTLTRSAEITRLQGQLNSRSLARGLNDERDAVSLAARAARAEIVDRLSTLGVEARTWGGNIGGSLASGLNSQYGVVRTAAGGLAGAVRGQIGILSEPKDSDSPLRGVTVWGGNLVHSVGKGIERELGYARGISRELAGALAPALGADIAGSYAGLGSGGRGSMNGNASGWEGTLRLVISGEGVTPSTAASIGEGVGRSLDAAGLLGALRLEASVR